MQDIDFSRGIWAVMSSPGYGLIIGSIPLLYAAASSMVLDLIKKRTCVVIDPCFGFKADAIPIQGPQGMGMTFFRQCTPLANCMGPGRLITVIESALLFEDMEDTDQRRHKGLVEQLMQQITAARAREAGIIPAGPGDMPSGPIIQS